MKASKDILSREDLQRMLGLKGGFGKAVAGLVSKVLEIDKVNYYHAKHDDVMGPDFARGVLEDLGISYHIPEGQLDRIPAEGGFITVSNHHFGSVDGLIMSDSVGRRRSDFKMLTTFMLSLIPNLSTSFLPVNNLTSRNDARSINSIRLALEHIHDGGGLGLFPAGEVATWQKKRKKTAVSGGRWVIEDKPWADNIIRLIKKSGLPVVPVYFHGTNSRNFHILGLIHRRLRTVRLVHELFNKRGTHVEVRIGQPVSPGELSKFESTEALGAYLRNLTYALEADCIQDPPKKASLVAQKPIMAPVDPELVRSEMASIGDKLLFESGDYRCYLALSADIPHVMEELARLREMIFRAVGEGSGEEKDTDIYDSYYRHLILWNVPDGRIAGAYRIGVGSDLMARPEGRKSFYTFSLFQFREGLDKYLPKALELGRTIVVPEYQKDILPLKLLLTGIMSTLARTPGIEYLMGPASISEDVPLFYKSLMAAYFLRNHSLVGASACVASTHPFVPDYLRVNPEGLLSGCKSPEDLDRLLSYLSGGKYHLPVLFRKYASMGAKVLEFNIDPLFNTLDAFVLQWMGDMPGNSYRSFSKFLTPEQAEEMRIRLKRNN
mgnify:FL=1